MWLIGGGESGFKSTIDEANKHLSALSQRVIELENVVAEMKKESEHKDIITNQYIKELTEKSELEMSTLRSKICDYGSTIRCLESDVKRRDTELNILRQRCRMLDEVMRYKTSLAKLTITLEQAEQYSKSVLRSCPNSQAAGGGQVMVHVDPVPRPVEAIQYIVDELPEDELIDKVGTTHINGMRSGLQRSMPTLAEKATKGYVY